MSRPCSCGSAPALIETIHACKPRPIHIMRLQCACGKHGATLMYTKPEDRLRTAQAAWDGWNLAGGQ